MFAKMSAEFLGIFMNFRSCKILGILSRVRLRIYDRNIQLKSEKFHEFLKTNLQKKHIAEQTKRLCPTYLHIAVRKKRYARPPARSSTPRCNSRGSFARNVYTRGSAVSAGAIEPSNHYSRTRYEYI